MQSTPKGFWIISILPPRALVGCLLLLAACFCSGESVQPDLRTYTVNRKVRDFPTNEDLSTPEGAYASLTRAWVASVKVPLEWLDAEALEVHIYRETNAAVFAKFKLDGNERIDIHWFKPGNGRWLDEGDDVANTSDKARELFSSRCIIAEARIALASRPSIAHPQEYLHSFVEFLRREAAGPKTFLLQALASHQVVILGEVHHRPRSWAFYSSLVREKTFVERVGVIYMELPGNDQALVGQFLTAPKYDPQPIMEMLRDVEDGSHLGWPDQGTLDFFKTVWEVNQGLPKEQRLRILLPDWERPWKTIAKRADWKKYDVDRDQRMADNILRDLREHSADLRHALFIVGYGHAMVNLSVGGAPMKSAGWRLREKLGDTNVFAVFPDSPVLGNWGGVNGRIALGLFEAAFAELTNRPMAFPLDHGPFGEQIFDASMDVVTADLFRNGYQAYLYLGPYEDEIFASIIPGFYTDGFVRELDRRYRLMNGKGLVEGTGVKRLDAESFMEWESNAPWGQLRHGWSAFELGPLDAWRQGGKWDSIPAKGSIARADWALMGQATPEAAFQSVLWAVNKGDLDSYLASVWLPPGSKPAAQVFAEMRSRTQSIAAFAIVSKETVSESNVTLNVDFHLGEERARERIVMKHLDGKWRMADTADQQ
ncbi:MAG: hypothetical protein ACLQVY_15140 [Limisphaerales bacterium]